MLDEKIIDLPEHLNPDGSEYFPLTVDTGGGVRSTMRLLLSKLADFILGVGRPVNHGTPGTVLAVDTAGNLNKVPGLTYDPVLGTLTIGLVNTASGNPSVAVTKDSNPAFPGDVFQVTNAFAGAAVPDILMCRNDGSTTVTNLFTGPNSELNIKYNSTGSTYPDEVQFVGTSDSFQLRMFDDNVDYPTATTTDLKLRVDQIINVLKGMGVLNTP